MLLENTLWRNRRRNSSFTVRIIYKIEIDIQVNYSYCIHSSAEVVLESIPWPSTELLWPSKLTAPWNCFFTRLVRWWSDLVSQGSRMVVEEQFPFHFAVDRVPCIIFADLDDCPAGRGRVFRCPRPHVGIRGDNSSGRQRAHRPDKSAATPSIHSPAAHPGKA